MKELDGEDLENAIKKELKNDLLTRNSSAVAKNTPVLINKSVTLTQDQIDFLIKTSGKETTRTKKQVSLSKVIREIINVYIKVYNK